MRNGLTSRGNLSKSTIQDSLRTLKKGEEEIFRKKR